MFFTPLDNCQPDAPHWKLPKIKKESHTRKEKKFSARNKSHSKKNFLGSELQIIPLFMRIELPDNTEASGGTLRSDWDLAGSPIELLVSCSYSSYPPFLFTIKLIILTFFRKKLIMEFMQCSFAQNLAALHHLCI